MKFNKNLLTTFINHNSSSIADKDFSFLNIAKPTGSILENIDLSNELLFMTYEKNYLKEGWYESNFDRCGLMDKIAKDKPDINIITDSTDIIDEYQNFSIMHVNDINVSIDQLYNYVINNVSPNIIGVTGSTGKTTTVAMIEQVINSEQNILRLYSKRITPLNLKSMVINFLENQHKHIVLEMSMNRKNHVYKLADMINPNISVIMNIGTAHLGTEDIYSKEDILDAKSQIIQDNSIPILNIDDPYIRKLKSNKSITFGLNSSLKPDISGKISGDRFELFYKNRLFIEVIPYILTELSLYQIMASVSVGIFLGIKKDNIINAINAFSPKENRIKSFTINNQKIIFDGDTTSSSRLKELGKSFYKNPILIISSVYSDLDNKEMQRQEFIKDVFPKFKAVYLLDNSKQANAMIDITQENVYMNCSESVYEILNKNKNSVVFINHGGYFRTNVESIRNSAFYELQELFKMQNTK